MSPLGAKIFGIVFGLIGVAVMLFGLKFYGSAKHIADVGLVAPGTVIRIDSKLDDEGGSLYRPVIDYPVDDEVLTYASEVWTSSIDYHVQQTVEILYDPDTPTDARINTFFGIYGMPLIAGGIGAVFFLVGLLTALSGYKRSREPKEDADSEPSAEDDGSGPSA